MGENNDAMLNTFVNKAIEAHAAVKFMECETDLLQTFANEWVWVQFNCCSD